MPKQLFVLKWQKLHTMKTPAFETKSKPLDFPIIFGPNVKDQNKSSVGKKLSFSSSGSASFGGCAAVGAVRSPWQRAQQKAARMQLLVSAAAGAAFARAQSMRAVRGADPHTPIHTPPALMTMTRAQWIRRWGRTRARSHPAAPTGGSLSIIHAPNCGWSALAADAAAGRSSSGPFLCLLWWRRRRCHNDCLHLTRARIESVKGNTSL